MTAHTIPATEKFDKIFQQVIKPFLNGQHSTCRKCDVITPADMYHLILKCKPGFDLINIHSSSDGGTERNDSHGVHAAPGISWWRDRLRGCFTKTKNGMRVEDDTMCRLGIRYMIDHFPAFSKATLNRGLSVGKGKNIFQVQPLSATLIQLAQDARPLPAEIRFFFKLTFSDGTSGKAGYVDMIKSNGRYRRIHVYGDGKIESAEIHEELRYMHDVYRTLMGQILFAEIYPWFYDRIRPYIQDVDFVDASSHPTETSPREFEISADNVVHFFGNRFKREDVTPIPDEAPSPPERIVL